MSSMQNENAAQNRELFDDVAFKLFLHYSFFSILVILLANGILADQRQRRATMHRVQLTETGTMQIRFSIAQIISQVSGNR